MWENFIIALTSVLPLFALMLIGVFVKYKKFLTPNER